MLSAPLLGQATPTLPKPNATPGKFHSEPVTEKSEADLSWISLQALIDRPKDVRQPIDWNDVENRAKSHREKFPNHEMAKEARKLEVIASLKKHAGPEKRAIGTNRKVEEFLNDKTILAKDRFDISALAKENELEALRGKDAQREGKRITHARQLIDEFPDDPRGYGYLLSIAKGQYAQKGEILAAEILKGPAPEAIKNGARRLLAQREMEGKSLSIDGLDLAKHKGRPVILYAWSIKRPEIFKTVGYWAQSYDVDLIGVNLDENQEVAKKLAEQLGVPGRQYYDGKGLDGPLASQLKFTMASSVYLIDKSGVLIDSLGQSDTLKKLDAFLDKKKGGRK